LLLVGLVLASVDSSPAALTPQELAEVALTSDDPAKREWAAGELCRREYAVAMPLIREVLADTRDANVRAVCLRAVRKFFDHQSLDMVIAAMEDDSRHVRKAAEDAAHHLLGLKIFHADAPPAERARQIRRVKADFEEVKDSDAYRQTIERIRQHHGIG